MTMYIIIIIMYIYHALINTDPERSDDTYLLKHNILYTCRGGRPGLSVLTSLLVSVDVKIYSTVLRHWSQLVPNMSTDI